MSNVRIFIENQEDDLHCLQACYIMVHEALTGEILDLPEAERRTGFVAGWPTWQFAMLNDFAARGYPTLDVERFDPSRFVSEPVQTIREQVGDDQVADDVLSQMSVDIEAKHLQACLDNPFVAFRNATPTLDNLSVALEHSAYILCNVNGNILHGKDGYLGHLVIVEGLDSKNCRLQDPGLPPARDMLVSRERFADAWMYPTETMANFYAIFPSVRKWETALEEIGSGLTASSSAKDA